MAITAQQLGRIMPHLPATKAETYLPFLNAAMHRFHLTDTNERCAMFLAMLAEESGELRWFEEIASGQAYEGRHDLGNTEPGDGRRFKGRGPLQLTGRANYAKYGHLLDVDLINHPEQAATPAVGFLIAGLFWELHHLNEPSDRGDVETVTRRVNGGLNGLETRRAYFHKALKVLSS